MLNIVIPMAGRGQRFVSAGYTTPKPLIPVHGVPMTRLVIENLRPQTDHRFIFLVLNEHCAQYALHERLQEWAPGCVVRPVVSVTEGAACTVLLARDLIDSSEPLMIANCDQWVDVSIDNYLTHMAEHDLDGLIMTMTANDPKWSFVRFDEMGSITEVVEKQVVSNEATVGIYNYRRGDQFVQAAKRMIDKNLRVNGEFYVAPAYNEMIETGAQLGVYNVGREDAGMYGLGVPSDLKRFVEHPMSLEAVRVITSC